MDDNGCESQIVPLIPHIIGEPDAVSAQTFLMLAVFYLFRAHEDRGLIYQNIACRHLFALGAHVHPAHRFEQVCFDEEEFCLRTRRHLRRLFWIAYWSDGELSLRTGRPPSFDDDYCDLTLPSGHDESEVDAMDINLKPGLGVASIGYGLGSDDLHLAMVKSHVGKGLYSSSALRKTDARILCAVRELDDELEHWRMSVPEPHRPSLGAENHWLPTDDQNTNNYSALRLHYLHLMAIIHQASSCCRTLPSSEDGMGQLWGISSSIAISLHASRETLGHVGRLSSSLSTMRGMLFYPMTAALNIFCNILLDPLGPTVNEDLELVRSATELMKDVTKGAAAVRDKLWLPYFETFIAELVRLGRCSIDQAKMQRV